MSYEPRAGSIPAQVLAWLREEGAPAELSSRQIAQRLGKASANGLSTCLKVAVECGALVRRADAGGKVFYALGDEQARPKPGAGPAFEAALWTSGELFIRGADPIVAADGVECICVPAQHVPALARLLKGVP